MDINPDDFEPGMAPKVAMDDEGREIPDPTPIVIYLPSGPVTDYDRVRDIIRRELSIQARNEGLETEEEANDFEVDGDIFPVSPHEYDEATEAADREALAAEVERERKAKMAKKAPSAAPKEPPGEPEGVADPLEPEPDQG